MKAEVGALYTHYKNKESYKVIAIGFDSETETEVVVYEGQYNSPQFGNHPVWVRPRDMFEEKVLYEGQMVPRFEKVG